jgi:6-phosphogluconolactonase
MTRNFGRSALATVSLFCVFVLMACSSSSAPVLRNITITPPTATITVGSQGVTFTATAYYSDGSTANANSLVTWASSNPNVAQVSGGVVTPLNNGTTTISATATGVTAATAAVAVNTLVSIKVTPANQTVAISGTQQYDAVGTFSDNSTSDITTQVSWSASSSSVSISSGGLATVSSTATSGTQSTISAFLYGVTGSTTMTIGAAGATTLQITVTPNVTTLAVGNSVTLLAQEVTGGVPQAPTNVVAWTNGTPATANLLTLTPNNQETSLVNALATGSTTITATDGSLVAQVTLTVVTGSTHFAYVSNNSDGTIGSFTVTASTSPYLTALSPLNNVAAPQQIALNPSGQVLYWVDITTDVSSASIASDGTLSNAASTPIGSIAVFPFAAVDPFGRFLYVSNDQNSTIYGYVLNSDGTISSTPPTTITTNLSDPQGLYIDRSGNYLYATNNGTNQISAYSINQTTGALSALTAMPTIATGAGPIYATWDPTKTYLFVADGNDNTIAAFSLGAGGVLSQVGAQPFAVTGSSFIFNVAVDPSGTHIYALDEGSGGNGQVFGFNLSGGTISSTAVTGTPIATGSTPIGNIVIDPTGVLMAVDNAGDGTISVYSITSGTGVLTAGTPVVSGSGANSGPEYITFLNLP